MTDTKIQETPKKSKSFKWFVAILAFIAFVIFISTIQNVVSDLSKSEFDSCYEQCVSLGKAPNASGICEATEHCTNWVTIGEAPITKDDESCVLQKVEYHKVNNWCVKDGKEDVCLNKCT